MPKKKRPNNAPSAVLNGNVFATFVKEAQSIGSEVVARREYDADVGEFLKERGLLVAWADWRKAKRES